MILDTLSMKILTQNFKGTFLGANKVIHDINDDPVIQVSCQEPSMSSNYLHERHPHSWHISYEDINMKILG